MIVSAAAKFLLDLPEPVRKPLIKYVVDKYIRHYADLKILNKENIKIIKQPVIFVSNHLSNSDAVVLNLVLQNINPYFVAGIKLTNNPITKMGLAAFNIIPIHPNTPDISAIKACIEEIKEGRSVFIFPEGTRSRTGEMLEAKKGVSLIARKCRVPIVPIGITGTEKLLPVNDKNMEEEKFNHAKVFVNIGEQILLPERKDGEDRNTYDGKCINKIMYSIAELLPEEYRGFYKSDNCK